MSGERKQRVAAVDERGLRGLRLLCEGVSSPGHRGGPGDPGTGG